MRTPSCPANDRAADGGLWAPSRRALSTGLVLSTTFIAAEALSVITIMPRVARALGGLQLYGWVFSTFMLASLIGTVAAGRSADRRGPAGAFAAAVALFAAGLALAGAAGSMPVLIVARAVQGLGAGAVEAIAYVVVSRAFDGALRTRMLAVLASAWVLPGLFGPVLAALVTRLLGWRWVFLGLIPLVALAGALALPALLALGAPAASGEDQHRLRDAALAAGGGALLLAGLATRTAALAAVLVAGGIALGVPALRRLLPAGALSARRGLPATILGRGLLTFSFFGADAFVTFAVVVVEHHSTTVASVVVTASTLTWTAGAWLQARLMESREGRSLVRAGLVLLLAGIAAMALSLHHAVSVAMPAGAWALAGLGIGLAYSPGSLMMMREVPAGREGWGSASLYLAEVVGIAFGTGACGAVVLAAERAGWAPSGALAAAFALAAAGAAAALALSGRLPSLAASARAPGRLASQPSSEGASPLRSTP
jgi:MFS family permease